MNIAPLEGRLQELLDIEKAIINRDEHYKSDTRIYRISQQLKRLTSDEYPKDVSHKMLYKSELKG